MLDSMNFWSAGFRGSFLYTGAAALISAFPVSLEGAFAKDGVLVPMEVGFFFWLTLRT